jgi:hypothetical protein
MGGDRSQRKDISTVEAEFEKNKSELTFYPNTRKPRLFSPQPRILPADKPASRPSNG